MNDNFTRIILTDDDEDDRMFFIDVFDELKIKTAVETVNNGKELLERINDHSIQLPNIIFLDLNMPIMNGLECLKEIKKNPRFQEIVIAIYSTSSSEQDVENTFTLGANIYIRKPNDFPSLKKVLTEVVSINWLYNTNGLKKENFLLKI